jgi:hypothetical protein
MKIRDRLAAYLYNGACNGNGLDSTLSMAAPKNNARF